MFSHSIFGFRLSAPTADRSQQMQCYCFCFTVHKQKCRLRLPKSFAKIGISPKGWDGFEQVQHQMKATISCYYHLKGKLRLLRFRDFSAIFLTLVRNFPLWFDAILKILKKNDQNSQRVGLIWANSTPKESYTILLLPPQRKIATFAISRFLNHFRNSGQRFLLMIRRHVGFFEKNGDL